MGTRKHTYDLPRFFCVDHWWETLTWSTVSPTQHKDHEACKWLWGARIPPAGTPGFPQPQRLSPEQAELPNARWRQELLTRTEAVMSRHARRASEAWGQVGRWGQQPSLPDSTRAGEGCCWFSEAHGGDVHNWVSPMVSISCSWIGWISVDLSYFLDWSVLTKVLCKAM